MLNWCANQCSCSGNQFSIEPNADAEMEEDTDEPMLTDMMIVTDEP
jgi:hypothetical protein